MSKQNKTRGKGGLRRKLLLSILPAVLVTIVVLVTVAAVVSGRRIKTMATEELSSSVENQQESIEAWLDENLQNFQSEKKAIESLSADGATIQTILDSFYGYNKNTADGIRIATASGQIYQAADTENKMTGDPTGTEWYKQGLNSINMNYGAAYTNPQGEQVISAIGMLNDGTDEVKVAAADLSLNKISTIVNSGVKMSGASAFLVDTNTGVMLANPDPSLVGQKLSEISDNFLLRGINGLVLKRNYNSTTVDKNLVAFAEVKGTDWVLISYIPTATIYQSVTQMVLILVVVGIIAAALITLLISLIVSRVIAPLTGITDNITAMSQGDFTISVNAKSNDEIGAMGRSVSDFVARMRQMLSSINKESEKLREQSASSDRVSKAMFDDSSAQSEAMKSLNETVDQLAAAVNDIAENATTLAMVVSDTRTKSDEAGDAMRETVKLSRDGRDGMQRLSVAMTQIEESNNALVDSINEVGNASEKITEIVGLISDIAEETNLLSLNASIEAARAGEAGKGFAVVATEIGKLANTSSDSANNIAGLIEQVRFLIANVVSQADASAESIRANTELINSAVATFDSIFSNIQKSDELIRDMVADVDKVNDVASNVAAISEEQAASSTEILQTSQAMVEKAQDITKSSQDVADNSQALADTSDSLTDYVNQFKI